MADEPKPLTKTERVEAVLRSQGHALARLPSLPLDIQDELAELCDEHGVFADGTRDKAKQILGDYFHGQKAVVDEEPKGFGLPKPLEPTE